jgi:glutamyl-tRNA synthetase
MSGRKLSKRDGNAFLVKEYQNEGILPEALVNYVALFGWSAKTDSDVHSMQDLISRVLHLVYVANKFTLDGLTTGSLKVSPAKLPFLNHQHILQKLTSTQGLDNLVDSALPFLREHLSPEY